ncbi:hypothetical protein VOLCADRAFT_121219 [Volvox carteri f. nagariensis]|uniref:DUF1517 domain-containing protein n=1 Tax=Volvox carteri f. nagariensis TaxID=3068 RepID=D8U5B2_VOLCA|nr:uncharacterized protein VOLCADRAFT_121219 [Volvox carteri f. nagariensis]EFJ45118.1 hypothetical protein VOLCADRAFT_121219 [Volvox carteri f. nagariensis]|eukprot:XP_002953794.1 hypothetical protein VOLCADRAFT_121219 [Volvox carteri f. nagariensis]
MQQQQLDRCGSLRSRHQASFVVPAFSRRLAPHSFKPCSKPSSPARWQAATTRPHIERQSIRAQAVARPSVYFFGFGGDDEDYEEEYTVMKVQVGLFGDVRKWQKDLERLSELFDTEDEESLHFILQETITKLLRNMEYVSYGQTAGKMFDNLDNCERKFNQVSLEERTKFKEETYSNVDGRRRVQSIDIKQSWDSGIDNWLCVTLLVAVEGRLKLPKISSSADMRKALTALGSITPETLLAFELLWTPQAEGDSYSKDELLQDFPTLALL